MLIDSPPQVLPHPTDLDEDLVKVPLVSWLGRSAPKSAGVLGPELRALGANRLIGHPYSTGGHEQFDLPEREGEPVIQPHAVGDDLPGKAETLVRRRHSLDHPRPSDFNNLTVHAGSRSSGTASEQMQQHSRSVRVGALRR